MIAEALRDLERFLLPNQCIVCSRGVFGVDPDGLVCTVCTSRLRKLGPAGCSRCRQPLPPVGPCRYCREWEPALQSVRSAVWLGTEARQIVHGLKYGYRPRLAALVARVMTSTLEPPPGSPVLVPVPSTPSRLRRRGYNQAELIARALAERWRLRVRTDLVSRRDDHGSQTALTPGARLANVAGVFHADPRGTGAPRSDPLLLIDDVLTTGATLAAVAAAFAQAGWTSLAAVTFARAEPYEEAADRY